MTCLFPEDLLAAARSLLDDCRKRSLRLAMAESCTGGLVAALLTEFPGSSDVVERGFVTYSNAAKMELLGVEAALLSRHGAVSREVARAMADGALLHSAADISVSVTGIAGPGGGSTERPVGLVHFGVARRGFPTLDAEHRFGAVGRHEVRMASVRAALGLLRLALEAPSPAVSRG